MTANFRLCPDGHSLSAVVPRAPRQEGTAVQAVRKPLLCRYPSGPAIAVHRSMLMRLKRRYAMSPLMLMVLLSVVPFPILAIAILADHWIRPTHKAVS